jgi:hypothetical protein
LNIKPGAKAVSSYWNQSSRNSCFPASH